MSTAAASECGLPLCELDRMALKTVQLVSAEVLVARSVSEYVVDSVSGAPAA